MHLWEEVAFNIFHSRTFKESEENNAGQKKPRKKRMKIIAGDISTCRQFKPSGY